MSKPLHLVLDEEHVRVDVGERILVEGRIIWARQPTLRRRVIGKRNVEKETAPKERKKEKGDHEENKDEKEAPQKKMVRFSCLT